MSIDYSSGSDNMDYEAHEQTYRNFIKLSIWAIIVVATILTGMFLFLT